MTRAEWQAAIRFLHRLSACVVVIFIVAHLANHLIGLGGEQAHRDTLLALRSIYRNPVVEPILLACFVWQGLSGFYLVVAGWSARRGLIAWAQAASGVTLATFVAIHVSAVFAGRASGLDTDLRFAAAGFQVSGWPFFFAPYYFLAVSAVFIHLGAAGYWLLGAGRQGTCTFWFTGLLGLTVALLIVLMLAGRFYPMVIEAPYIMPFVK